MSILLLRNQMFTNNCELTTTSMLPQENSKNNRETCLYILCIHFVSFCAAACVMADHIGVIARTKNVLTKENSL